MIRRELTRTVYHHYVEGTDYFYKQTISRDGLETVLVLSYKQPDDVLYSAHNLKQADTWMEAKLVLDKIEGA